MASEKMIEAADKMLFIKTGNAGLTRITEISGVSEAITAAIDAAWTRYSPRNIETLPQSRYAPDGRPWEVLLDERQHSWETIKFVRSAVFDDRPEHLCFTDQFGNYLHVIAYADPIDLTPSWVKNETRTNQ